MHHQVSYVFQSFHANDLIDTMTRIDDNKKTITFQDVARLIAECYANPDKPHISFLVVEAKKSNLEPKPTALIFLEA